MSTPPKKFGREDATKTLRDAIIVAVAAGIACVAEILLPELQRSGVLTAATVAAVAGVISAFRRWVSDTRLERTK